MKAEHAGRRIGIFGGTFDPIHIGHLIIAEMAREHLSLEKVIFIPAAQSPLKLEHEPVVSAQNRLEMVTLSIAGNPYFEVNDIEIKRAGTSYTVDTLEALVAGQPEDDLYLIIGADSLSSFHRWRNPRRICELARVVVLARGGEAPPNLELLAEFLPDEQKEQLTDRLVPTPVVEVSSTDLRSRIADHKSTRYQLHAAVRAYIEAKGLYQA